MPYKHRSKLTHTPITVIIPTYNEERFIKQALQAASFADECLIIDSYSTDNTLAIAKQWNCKVIKRKFDDFSSQKNYAIKEAAHDWIFILDADEFLLPKLQEEIQQAIQSKKHQAYKVLRRNFFINRFLKNGSNGRDSAVRLINKNTCHYEGLVHERMIVAGSTGTLSSYMYHYTYTNLRTFLVKKNKYAALQAAQKHHKGAKTVFMHLLIKPAGRFWGEYILKKGFLDGVAGLTSTRMNGYGVLSRYIKLRNLSHKTKNEHLQGYDVFSLKLNEEASSNKIDSPILGAFSFWLLPKITFIKYYLFKGYILKGMDGYALSYLYSFQKFQRLIYGWLAKRGID
ncbi:glycosyltransferase family 2 protein [Leeuwenhoekiella sp. W20_SRS_FM14]|uniref:glycosyltransferase family 2 protein n=1 Tax=Leeuwenhoekiella sp. W20_SRS_FM14 TaxID=3240270 RepID=UPI003F959E11